MAADSPKPRPSREGPTTNIGSHLNLRVLTWAAIVLPVAFLAALDVVRHLVFPEFLHTLPGFLATYAMIAGGVVAFSFCVFGLIRRLQRRIIDQNSQLSALNEIARATTTKLVLQELLDASLDQTLADLRADAGLICIVDADKQEHTAVCHRGFSQELVSRLQRAKLQSTPIADQVVHTGRPVVWERILEEPRVTEAARREGVRSGISAPLKAEGEVTGILVVATRNERRFSVEDREFLETVGGQLGIVIRNTVLYERAQARNRELAALLEIGRATAAADDLERLLSQTLDTLIRLTSADAAEVWLTGPDGSLAMRSHRGASPGAFLERTRLEPGEGIPGIVVQTRSPVFTHDLANDARFVRQTVTREGFKTFGAVPLMYRGAPVGVLAVAALSGAAFVGHEESRLLEGVAEHLAMGIENARLQQQVQDSAVLLERERIAREMHDGTGQLLGYINVQSTAVKALMARGELEAAREELTRLQQVARDLYADVREGILGLRAAGQPTGSFFGAIADYIGSYRAMFGIDARIQLAPGVEDTALAPGAEIQLMRIVQEALTNVRKHARASTATVRFERIGDHLLSTIGDDGQGFDVVRLASDGRARFGLETMRERAEAVGGSVEIEAERGRGTTIRVRIPATERKR